MLGVILATLGTLLDEVSTSIGKLKVSQKLESVYTMGFLGTFFSTIGFVLIGLLQNNYVFQAASLPTFTLRAFLEIAQAHVAMLAVNRADRSTFGFIRTLTIPLLVLVDLILGYKINNFQIAGLGLIIITLFFIFIGKDIKKKGAGLVLFTAINAVITLSLYKYDITHFNSVAAEQSIINLLILLYFLLAANIFTKENPFRFLTKPIFFAQSAADGVASLLIGFAYKFAPASIILACVRSTSVFWTVVSGGLYFRERHIAVKLMILVLLAVGIILLFV
jgi:hypothetical protein